MEIKKVALIHQNEKDIMKRIIRLERDYRNLKKTYDNQCQNRMKALDDLKELIYYLNDVNVCETQAKAIEKITLSLLEHL